MTVLTPREQGDLGEISAIEWLAGEGYTVFFPLGHSPDVDLLALRGHVVLRVQAKTCTRVMNGRWSVSLCTRGGNQSWSRVVKRFSADRCDRLFVLAGDGRRWFIPAEAVGGGTAVALGGPKYAAFEVARGRPIATLRRAPAG
jgi:hypothetical protein